MFQALDKDDSKEVDWEEFLSYFAVEVVVPLRDYYRKLNHAAQVSYGWHNLTAQRRAAAAGGAAIPARLRMFRRRFAI